MKWSYQEVAHPHLVWKNSPLDWDFLEEDPVLRQSLHAHGLLVPLLVQSLGNGQFCLIDGFKRVRLLSVQSVAPDWPCLVLPPDICAQQIARVRATTQGKQNFKGWEICQILEKLQQLPVDESFVVEEILPKLGLKPSQRMMRDLHHLNQLVRWENAPFLSNYMAEELLPLLNFSPAEVKGLLQNLGDLSLGGNKWKSLLHLLKEVSRLQGKSLLEIMESPELAQILHNPQLQPPVRFRLLKQQLEAWRYPELTKMRSHFLKKVKALHLSSQSSIEHDPFFEKDWLELKIQTNSVEALKAELAKLTQSLHMEAWETLFEVMKGE